MSNPLYDAMDEVSRTLAQSTHESAEVAVARLTSACLALPEGQGLQAALHLLVIVQCRLQARAQA